MSSETRIRLLSDNVANKIAAGEVVERPAAVLKELMENAIDAGARRIDVQIAAGGRKLILVQDDGVGMGRDDALLSIERHATSKIREADDIERVQTLGFRGEALAAIASVSRFRLTTCAAGEAVGTRLQVNGGKLQAVDDTAGPSGTCIEVRDLFYNIPARRKFMRTDQTELSHLRTVFNNQALANCGVGMSLTVDGVELHRFAPGAVPAERINELCGPELHSGLMEAVYEHSGVKVSGMISRPVLHRADRSEQYVFINRRAASAPVVMYALREGYQGLLPSGRHPVVFLYLSLPAGDVDVNVHPTKREVRFRRSNAVRDAVIGAIRQTLGGIGREVDKGVADDSDISLPPVAAPRALHRQLQIKGMPQAGVFRYPGGGMRTLPPETGSGDGGIEQQPATDEAGDRPVLWQWCRVVGQIGGLYVLLETDEGMVVMDPHAAHERVIYERMLKSGNSASAVIQALLLPETVNLPPREAALLARHLELLRGMGFGIEVFGDNTFKVESLPAALGNAPADVLLQEIILGIKEGRSAGKQMKRIEETVARAACRAAVRGRNVLGLDELEQLVADLAQTEMPYTCPHGRPSLIFTSFRELQRKFGR